jgi:hypothetical protein
VVTFLHLLASFAIQQLSLVTTSMLVLLESTSQFTVVKILHTALTVNLVIFSNISPHQAASLVLLVISAVTKLPLLSACLEPFRQHRKILVRIAQAERIFQRQLLQFAYLAQRGITAIIKRLPLAVSRELIQSFKQIRVQIARTALTLQLVSRLRAVYALPHTPALLNQLIRFHAPWERTALLVQASAQSAMQASFAQQLEQ